MTERNAIVLKAISKNYRNAALDVQALRGISLTIARGEYVAIMGPSGSGKSTLMNVLGCLDRPSSGSFALDGIDVARLGDNELSRIRLRKLGFIFQGFNLLTHMDALNNVELPLLYAGVSKERRTAIALERLRAVGLAHRSGHKPSELSGGQQQRVAIARALVNDPAILLADEPTGNLDSQTSIEILDLFTKLHDAGRTILLVTHDDEVARHAERVIRLRDGLIVADDRKSAG
jgi:putative ABC transport system ATP-binding protein